MSRESFLKFLLTVRNDPIRLAEYDRRNLSQLLFHARTEGFDFSAEVRIGGAGFQEHLTPGATTRLRVARTRVPVRALIRSWRAQRALGSWSRRIRSGKSACGTGCRATCSTPRVHGDWRRARALR